MSRSHAGWVSLLAVVTMTTVVSTTTDGAAVTGTVPSAAVPGLALPSAVDRALAGPAVPGLRARGSGFLVTGERVHLVHGRPVVSAHGPGDLSTVAVHLGGHVYQLPQAALPYVGRPLDLSLFDATRAARRDKATLPVTIRHRGPVSGLAGVTITRDAGGKATGYLTASGARRFGQALASDPGRLLANVVRLTTDRPYARQPAAAAPLYDVTVDATLDGTPVDDGIGVVADVEEADGFADILLVHGGVARLRLPAGRYSTFLAEVGEAADGHDIWRTVALDFEVLPVSGMQTFSLRMEEATATLGVDVPRPIAGLLAKEFYGRVSADDERHFGTIVSASPPHELRIQPMAAPDIGTITYAAAFHGYQHPLYSGRADDYSYDLVYVSDGVDADQTYEVSEGELATVTADHVADSAGIEGSMVRMANHRAVPLEQFMPVMGGTRRTEYVGGTPGLGYYLATLADPLAEDSTRLDSLGAVTYSSGSEVREPWREGPVAPGIPPMDATAFMPTCLACRTDGSMRLELVGLTDSEPSHIGGLWPNADGTPATTVSLRRNGRTLASREDAVGVRTAVPAARGRYRFVLDAERYTARARLSTRSRTEISFDSTAGRGPLAPTEWGCRGCRVLPVLQAKVSYPADLLQRVQPGVVPFTITASRIMGAAPAKVVSARFWVRPAGYAWTPVFVRRTGASEFVAEIDLPEWLLGAADVDIRVRVADDHGSVWDQTVQRAFRLDTGEQ